MFCANCGIKLEDGITKCLSCGEDMSTSSEEVILTEKTNFASASSTETVSSNEGNSVTQIDTKKVLEKPKMDVNEMIKKVTGNKMILGGIIVAIAIIAIVIVIAIQPKKFNVEDYVEVKYTGYNGYATASVRLDESLLYSDIMKSKGKSTDIDDYDSLWSLGTAIKDELLFEEIFDSIDLEITSESKNLSNGDVITVSIAYDNSIAKKSKIKFKGKSASMTVEDLEPVEEIDPFTDLEVAFYGTTPNGTIEYEYSGNNLNINYYSFTVDQWDGLRNGDTVTITIDADDDNTLYHGYIITNKEQQYEVSGLDEYVDEYTDLTDEFLVTLKSEAEDSIYSYVASSYNDDNKMKDLSYVGYIMNSVIDGSSYVSSYNNMYLIYKGTVSSSDGNFDTTDVYFPVRFSNILLSNDSLSYGDNNGIVGSSNLGDTWYSTKGYTNPLYCYMDIVESNSNGYTVECGNGFEQYGKYEMVTKLLDITEDEKKSIYTDAKKQIESYIESNYNGGSSASNLSVLGEYMLVAKNVTTNYSQNNVYIVVYSATVSNSNEDFETTTVYFPVEYDGIIKMASGEYIILSSEGIQGSTFFPDSYYSTKGYIDGATMYDKLVSANRENYTYEVSKDLQEFGK